MKAGVNIVEAMKEWLRGNYERFRERRVYPGQGGLSLEDGPGRGEKDMDVNRRRI